MNVSPTFLAVLRAHFGHLGAFDIKAIAYRVPNEYCLYCPKGSDNRTSVSILNAPRADNPFARRGETLCCRDCAPGLMAAAANERADEMKPIRVRVRP